MCSSNKESSEGSNKQFTLNKRGREIHYLKVNYSYRVTPISLFSIRKQKLSNIRIKNTLIN